MRRAPSARERAGVGPACSRSSACWLGAGRAATRGLTRSGLPDSYLLFVPATKDGQVRRGPTGLPVLEALALDDSRAVPYHKLFSVGFAAELLRTDYLRKQFVRDAHVDGKAFGAEARAGGRRADGLRARGRSAVRAAGRRARAGDAGLLRRRRRARATQPGSRFRRTPDSDTALAQTLSGRLGRAGRHRARGRRRRPIGRELGRSRSVLIDGYAQAMEVIAREWRDGRRARAGRWPPDAGTEAQRDAVRRRCGENRFVPSPAPDGHTLRPRRRAAGRSRASRRRSSTAWRSRRRVGRPGRARRGLRAVRRRIACRPGSARPPCSGRSATSRRSCWRPGRAPCLRGHPPHDIADLVEAYAARLPAERGRGDAHLRGHDLRRDREAGRRSTRRRTTSTASLAELTRAGGRGRARAAAPLRAAGECSRRARDGPVDNRAMQFDAHDTFWQGKTRRRHRRRRLPRQLRGRAAAGRGRATSSCRARATTTWSTARPCRAPARRRAARPGDSTWRRAWAASAPTATTPGRFLFDNLMMGAAAHRGGAPGAACAKLVAAGTICAYPEVRAGAVPRGRPLERLSRGDQRALRPRQEDAAGAVAGLSRAVRHQQRRAVPGEPLRPARQLRSARRRT